MEMDRKSCEKKNSDTATNEINQQHESQRLELYQASQRPDQALMENRRIFEELTMKSKLYQEHHARVCQEIEELQRICCKQADRVRQLGIDELSMQRKRTPPQ